MRYWQVNLVLGQLRFDASGYATRIAGEVKDFDVTNYGVDKKEARSHGPFCRNWLSVLLFLLVKMLILI